MISTLLLSMPGGAEWLLLLLILAFLVFWIFAIVDIARSKFSDDTTKVIWLLVVIFLGLLGAIIYWIFGRKSKLIGYEN